MAPASDSALSRALRMASRRTCSLYWSSFEWLTRSNETFEMPSASSACQTRATSSAEKSLSWYLAVESVLFFLKNSLERLDILSCSETLTPCFLSVEMRSRCWLSTEILPFESRSSMTIER